jgi:hypothetical protein
MSDATILLKVEAKKKSGWLAAFLNLVFPGAGYMYCGRWILGIVAFVFVVGVGMATAGIGAAPFVLVLIVDGFLAAGRYNKKLIESVLAEEELKEKAAQPRVVQA